MAKSAPALKTETPAVGDKPLTGIAKINAERKAAKAAKEAAANVPVDPKLEAASYIAHGTTPEAEAAATEEAAAQELATDAQDNPVMDALISAIHTVKPTFRQLPGQDEDEFVKQMLLVLQDLPDEIYDNLPAEAQEWYTRQCELADGRTLPDGVVFSPIEDAAAQPAAVAPKGRPVPAAAKAGKAAAEPKVAKEKAPKAPKAGKPVRDWQKSKTTIISRFVIENEHAGFDDVKKHMEAQGLAVQDATITAQMTQTRGVVKLLKLMGRYKG